jgi:hypothetical protein
VFSCLPLTTIDWGNLTPSQSKTVTFYIQNQAQTPLYLISSTNTWNPTNAQNHIQTTFNLQNQLLNKTEVRKATLTLTIAYDVSNITNFTFNILIKAQDTLPGDLNADGTVNIRDIAILVNLYATTPTSPNWNPNADLDNNQRINMRDIALTVQAFGTKTP